ncbi:MAG: hypothetical protein ACIALR_14860 [Blastopirellula sp. JB062]
MAEARGRHDWNQTAALMALTAEINRDRKQRSRSFEPDDFNPYAEPKPKGNGIPFTKENRAVLRKMFNAE